FERVSEDIVSEGGLVNKFVGDGILAIFGAPIPLENSSLAAVRAGTKIRETVRLINGDDSSQNLPNIDIGLGIHTGPVLAGNIGSKSRMEYTVIGDTVNIASRVENLCKEFGKDFLITKSVKDQILDAGFKPIFLDSVKIRGKENLSDIYWL
ncbi:MAG: adenylate/guanylate cyclase domain-containing protein, partial [Leptospiraceae bacterium]|nr:adenylate/guanylate cyclase domain-containing protein [Leptospiraceae bacterium]